MLEFVMFVFYYYFPQFAVVMCLLKVCNGVFLYFQQYDKWYLGMIPFAHTYYKYELAGVNPVWTVLDALLGLCSVITFHVLFIASWWVLRSIADYKYASIFIDDCNPVIYAVVPFAKYIIMIKEAIIYARA